MKDVHLSNKTKLKIKLWNLDNYIKNHKVDFEYRIENDDIIYSYTCSKCGKKFELNHRKKFGRLIHCEECKSKRPHNKNIEEIKSVFELSSRTRSKILKRMKLGCFICGWNEATLDTHHIIYRSKKGTDDHSNLIYVCPNCHRIIHSTDKFSEDFLKQKCIEKNDYFEKNWKQFYLK